MSDFKDKVNNLIKLAFSRGRAYGELKELPDNFDIKGLDKNLKLAEKAVREHTKRDYLVRTIIEQASDCGIEYGKYPNIALGRMNNLSNYRADLLYGYNLHVTNFTDEDDDSRSFKQCVKELNELITLLEK